MSVILILPNNRYLSPYIESYVSICEKCSVNYQILSWNRNGVNEDNVLSFNKKIENKNIVYKFYCYVLFVLFVYRQIRKHRDVKIVSFTIVSTLLLYPIFYKKKIIFDIRDYSPIVKYLPRYFEYIIKKSSVVVISSAGFVRWLPKSYSYLICHNLSVSNHFNFNISHFTFLDKIKPIVITTIGQIRDFYANRILIDKIAGDERFVLKFIGESAIAEELKVYTKSKGYRNVEFLGRYLKNDEIDLLKDSDLLNLLMDDDVNSKTLMSNRFYLSVCLKKPCIVNFDTIQGEVVSKYGVGVIVNNINDVKSDIIKFVNNFDLKVYEDNVQRLLNEISAEQNKFYQVIKLQIINVQG